MTSHTVRKHTVPVGDQKYPKIGEQQLLVLGFSNKTEFPRFFSILLGRGGLVKSRKISGTQFCTRIRESSAGFDHCALFDQVRVIVTKGYSSIIIWVQPGAYIYLAKR
jgi:hypothetical protein